MSDESVSMWAFPSQYGRRFEFHLSPSPEYRSAMMDCETGTIIAETWEGEVHIDNGKLDSESNQEAGSASQGASRS